MADLSAYNPKPWPDIYLLIAVPFVLLGFLSWRLIMLAFAMVMPIVKLLRIRLWCRRYPLPIMIFSSSAAIGLNVAILALLANNRPIAAAILTILWLVFCFSLYLSAINANAQPPTINVVDKIVSERWPERWFASRLHNSRDAFFVRFLLNNFIIMAPAWIVLINPALFGVLSCIYFLVCMEALGFAHETLDHTNMHNHLFRAKRGADRRVASLFKCLDIYQRWILDPICMRIPNYYKTYHLYVHHVEDNGPSDVHTTLMYDRLSFFDFCHASLRKALSLLFGVDVARYLWVRRKYKRVRTLYVGFGIWFLLIGLIACFNWKAAVFLMILRAFQGILHATNNISWHGFVDPDSPADPSLNSVTILAPPYLGGGIHIEHHLRPGEHWSSLHLSAENNKQLHYKKGALLFVSGSWLGFNFLKILWTRRFDILWNYAVVDETGTAALEEYRKCLLSRTSSIYPSRRGERLRGMDLKLGLYVSKFLLGGVVGTQRARAAAEAQMTSLGVRAARQI